MKSSFIRMTAVVLLSVSGVSFLNTAFPSVPWFPAIVFSLSIALSLSDGFMRSLPSVILIGLVADIAMLGRIGVLSAFCAGLAYAASFFSRRFAVEHGVMSHAFSGFLVGSGIFLFPVASLLIADPGGWRESVSLMSGTSAAASILVGTIAFVVVSPLARRFREWLSYFDTPRLT